VSERPRWSRIPLAGALADLRRARTRGTITLYAAIAATAVLLASVPVCGPVQDQLARAHHARPQSLVHWAAFQVVPKMYSFAHRVWRAGEPITDEALSRAEGPGLAYRTLWLNHYPVRIARFESGRAEIVERGEDVHLLVRTSYRGRRWVSRFVVHVEGGGLVLEALEPAP
jgi:hypothetical protein